MFDIGDHCIINVSFDEAEVMLYGYSHQAIAKMKRANQIFIIDGIFNAPRGVIYTLKDITSGEMFNYYVYGFLLIKKPSTVINGLFDIVMKGG